MFLSKNDSYPFFYVSDDTVLEIVIVVVIPAQIEFRCSISVPFVRMSLTQMNERTSECVTVTVTVLVMCCLIPKLQLG